VTSTPLAPLDADQLRLVVPIPTAIDELEKALRDLADVVCPPRTAIQIGDGQLLTMPAAAAQARRTERA
jgi:hypothetical protein